MIMTPTITAISMSVIASTFMVVSYCMGRNDGKKADKIDVPLLCALTICIFVCLLLLSSETDRATPEMRRRLNQPIVSEEQLYGYKIVGKKAFHNESLVYSSSPSIYLISIEDLLGNKKTVLRGIEVSEEFFSDHETGDRFLQEDKSDIPITGSQ